MNKQLSKLFLLSAVLSGLLTALPASAGSEGHGADGILINGKPYLRDLVEFGNGIAYNPFFDKSIKVDPALQTAVNKSLSAINKYGAPAKLVAQKLAEIATVNRGFALSLLRGIELYNWSIQDQPGQEHPETGNLLKRTPVQLATRGGNHISIFETLWNLMDAPNRAALIIHEIIYAYVAPIWARDQDNDNFLYQDAQIARNITGYLFTANLEAKGLDGILAQRLGSSNTFWWLEDGTDYAWLDRDTGYFLRFHGLSFGVTSNGRYDFIYDIYNSTSLDTNLIAKECQDAVKNGTEVVLNQWNRAIHLWFSYDKNALNPDDTAYLQGAYYSGQWSNGDYSIEFFRKKFDDISVCNTEVVTAAGKTLSEAAKQNLNW